MNILKMRYNFDEYFLELSNRLIDESGGCSPKMFIQSIHKSESIPKN